MKSAKQVHFYPPRGHIQPERLFHSYIQPSPWGLWTLGDIPGGLLRTVSYHAVGKGLFKEQEKKNTCLWVH